MATRVLQPGLSVWGGGGLGPESIDGLILYAVPGEETFQDTGGTTPADEETEPIGLLRDQSGHFNHLTQAAADSRPQFASVTNGGKTFVAAEYDGTDDFLEALLLATFTVEANTAGSGAPNVLTADESRRLLTNEGATAQNYHTLPTAAAGLEFSFVVADADGIRVVAGADDTIRIEGSVSAAAGFAESTTIGSTLRLVAINAVEWCAISITGSWTVT